MGISMSQQSINIDGNSKMYLQNGTQGSGKILTSDVDGNLSWRDKTKSTFTNSISPFPVFGGGGQTINAQAFYHYYTVGERTSIDGAHILILPSTPTEGDMIRLTNTSIVSNYIYIKSDAHSIYYTTDVADQYVNNPIGTYIRLFSALTIEFTFINKNPSYPTYVGAKPQINAWYVTNLSGITYV